MKIATIGTGTIVETMIDAAKKIPDVQVVAACSRQAARATALAERFGIPTTYTSLEAMLADPAIDTVYIATPNSLHFEQARQALQAGKHVILEKPLTSTAAEAQALSLLARERKLFLFEAISTMHLPNYRDAWNHLAEIGPVRLIQCNYSQYSSRYTQLKAGHVTNVFDPAFSGGCLYDLNIYNLHFVIGLLGRPRQIHAFSHQAANGIDTSGTVVLTYPDCLAICTAAKDSASPSFQIIQGEDGFIQFNGPTNQCPVFEVQVGTHHAIFNHQTAENRLVYEIGDFADCLQRQDREMADRWLDHSLLVMEVAEAARRDAGILFLADFPVKK